MPPPIPPNPIDIPSNIPMTTAVLSHFANLKLTGDRLVRDTVITLAQQAPSPALTPAPKRAPRRRRLRRRTARVHKLSDADLEAELAARRAARARERESYARGIRSEKLTILENELNRLRSQLSRMDRNTIFRSGTPPTVKWEALPDRRRSTSTPPQPSNAAPAAPSAPPPPPPRDEVVVDPEKRRREKEERMKRREAKRKEREANRKPLTLAEIIKSAGPDPMKRLKPPGSIPVPDVHAPEEVAGEDIQGAKDALKKVSRPDPGHGDNKEEESPSGERDGEEKAGEVKNLGKENDASEGKMEIGEEKNSDDGQQAKGDPKPAEDQSPTKVMNTGTSPEKPTSPVKANTENTQEETEENKKDPLTKGTTDAKDDTTANGTPNGSLDALAALSKLKAKLPDKPGDSADKKDNVGERKKLSVEEKRRMRRAAKEKDVTVDKSVLNVD